MILRVMPEFSTIILPNPWGLSFDTIARAQAENLQKGSFEEDATETQKWGARAKPRGGLEDRAKFSLVFSV